MALYHNTTKLEQLETIVCLMMRQHMRKELSRARALLLKLSLTRNTKEKRHKNDYGEKCITFNRILNG